MSEDKVFYKATIIYNNSTNSIGKDANGNQEFNNWWALSALVLVVGTAAGNILVCLAITWERRLQNVTNYFLMSLAITDLMVAILVMPLGILTLVRGELKSENKADMIGIKKVHPRTTCSFPRLLADFCTVILTKR